MATISVDLRQRILKAYDRGDTTREQVASRFEVSLGMVKKLIQQRRHSGDIAPRHHRSGRKPIILDSHRRELRSLVSKQPDLTFGGNSCASRPCVHDSSDPLRSRRHGVDI